MDGLELRIAETQRELPQRRQLLADHSGWLALHFSVGIALKDDGTVLTFGTDKAYDTQYWRDIVAVGAGMNFVVGLKANGTLVADGVSYDGRCSVALWTDITAIAVGECHTVGLKRDGTVVSTGPNKHGECNVEGWRDVVAIAANDCRTVGITRDGSLIWVGKPLSQYEQEIRPFRGGRFIWPIASQNRGAIGAISFGVYEYGDGDSIGITDADMTYRDAKNFSDRPVCSAACISSAMFDDVLLADGRAERFRKYPWFDLVALASSGHHLAAVRSDGTLVGTNDQWNLHGIRLFTDINTAIQARKQRLRSPEPVFSEELDKESYERISAAIDQGMGDQMLPLIQSYLDTDPDDTNAWQLLASYHRFRGDREGQIAAYKNAAQHDPDNAWVRMALYSVYGDLGNAEEALYWCDQAIAIERDPRYCLSRLDPLSFLEGDDVAMEACNQYRQEFPDVEDFSILHIGFLVRKAEALAMQTPYGGLRFPSPYAQASARRYLDQADQLADGLTDLTLAEEIETLRRQLRTALHGAAPASESPSRHAMPSSSPASGSLHNTPLGTPPPPLPDLSRYWIWSIILLFMGSPPALLALYNLIKLGQSHAEFDIKLYEEKVQKWCVWGTIFAIICVGIPLMALAAL